MMSVKVHSIKLCHMATWLEVGHFKFIKIKGFVHIGFLLQIYTTTLSFIHYLFQKRYDGLIIYTNIMVLLQLYPSTFCLHACHFIIQNSNKPTSFQNEFSPKPFFQDHFPPKSSFKNHFSQNHLYLKRNLPTLVSLWFVVANLVVGALLYAAVDNLLHPPYRRFLPLSTLSLSTMCLPRSSYNVGFFLTSLHHWFLSQNLSSWVSFIDLTAVVTPHPKIIACDHVGNDHLCIQHESPLEIVHKMPNKWINTNNKLNVR